MKNVLHCILVILVNVSFAQDRDHLLYEDEPIPALPSSIEEIFEGQVLPVEELRTCFSKVYVKVSSNSHNCNAAIFTLYANDIALLNSENGDSEINLNNGNNNSFDKNGRLKESSEDLNGNINDVGGYRESIINVNRQLADKVIKSTVDNLITLFLECSTPPNIDRGWGFGGCHSDVPFVKIVRVDNYNNSETIIFSGIPEVESVGNKVRLITFDPCFNIK